MNEKKIQTRNNNIKRLNSQQKKTILSQKKMITINDQLNKIKFSFVLKIS